MTKQEREALYERYLCEMSRDDPKAYQEHTEAMMFGAIAMKVLKFVVVIGFPALVIYVLLRDSGVLGWVIPAQ